MSYDIIIKLLQNSLVPQRETTVLLCNLHFIKPLWFAYFSLSLSLSLSLSFLRNETTLWIFFKENKSTLKHEAIALLFGSYNPHFINLFLICSLLHFFFKAMRQYHDCLNITTWPLLPLFVKSRAMIHYVQNVKWRKITTHKTYLVLGSSPKFHIESLGGMFFGRNHTFGILMLNALC